VRLLAVVGLALATASAAAGATCASRVAHLENQIMCPVCPAETVAQTDAPVAQRIKARIAHWCAAGKSDAQIKAQLVDAFGPRVLAAPPKKGFDLLAWWLPIVGIVVAGTVIGLAAWRWSRRGEGPPPGEPLDPELDRRVDEALRAFDS
jgi:cytochrome c-type biogenesis protein CcmH